MKIGFGLNLSQDIKIFVKLFCEIENDINEVIKERNYDSTISVIYIGWICVSPEFEQFFKPRKIKYSSNVVGVIDEVEVEVKLPYVNILKLNAKEFRSIVFMELIKIISTLNQNKKTENFKVDLLINDLKNISTAKES